MDGSGTNGQKWPHSWKSPMGEGSRDFAKCAASFVHLCHLGWGGQNLSIFSGSLFFRVQNSELGLALGLC